MALTKVLITISLLAFFFSSCRQPSAKEQKKVTKEMLLEMNRKMVNTEARVIEKYIEDNELEMIKSETGYYYQFKKTTEATQIQTNDFVILAYTTSLLNGTICYSSATNGLMEFTVGKAQVEAGLEQFITKMRKGDIAKLILPPYLAHGIAGDDNKIPKLSIIVMDIEVVDVKHASPIK